MTKSTAPKNAIASQLAAMSGKAVAPAAPQSRIARFINADIKGGEAKHDFIMSEIASAVVQALKGNQRDIPEAVKLCAGKSKKARSYQAGFQAIINDLKPEPYAGKYDSADNADVRERVTMRAATLNEAFEIAYLSVFHAPVEPKAPKAKKATEATDAADAADDEAAPAAPAAMLEAEHVVVSIDESVAAVVRALDGGLLETNEIQAIRLALLAYDSRMIDAQLAAKEAAAAIATATATEAATA